MNNIIAFPNRPSHSQKRAKRSADSFKYFTEPQIKLLRRTARNNAQLARQRRQITAVREWMLIDLLTCTGLREAEAANLRCGDLRIGYGECALFVRNGKGSKSRTVQIPGSLRVHLKSYLSWKRQRNESTGANEYLFIGQRGPWSGWAVGQVVKQRLRRLGLYEPGKSAHALRHSYAVELYRQKRDIRAVQKQLGHSNIHTTQKYADVLIEDIQAQIRGLWD